MCVALYLLFLHGLSIYWRFSVLGRLQDIMNEWMKWTLIYRLISGWSTRSLSGSHINRRFTADKLPTWVEQSQDLMLRSTVSFVIVTYLGTFLSFNHLSNCIFPCPLLFLAIYALHAGYLFVTDTLYITAMSKQRVQKSPLKTFKIHV